MPAASNAALLRALVSTALALLTLVFALPLVLGLTGSLPAAAVVGTLVAAGFGWACWRGGLAFLDPAAVSRGLLITSGLAAVLALVFFGRLVFFMTDASQVSCSFLPSSDFELHHSCLTAYYVAARGAGEGQNVYDGRLYSAPDDDPALKRKPLKLGAFNVDVYEYPPPFLLLPRALLPLARDFTPYRMIWFGLMGAVLIVAFLGVARQMGGAAGTRALLLSPLVLFSAGTFNTLQKGNVQLAVLALAMLAMAAFERRRYALGGVLLAFVSLSKLYPGLLVFYLLLRRDWKAFFWTSGCALVLLAVSVADTGLAPYSAFLGHLPGLLGGESFPAFRNPNAIAINYSVPGLIFKLKLFGVPGMGFPASKLLGWIYTVVVLGAIVVLARRRPSGVEKPLAWLAILILATLRSPFLPAAYAPFPALWLVVLLGAVALPSARALGLVLLGWLVLNIYIPQDWGVAPRTLALITLVPQALLVALAVVVLRRRDAAPAAA